jgi:hypothetical protein
LSVWFLPQVTLESEDGSCTKRIALGPVPLQLAGLQALVAAAFRLPLGAQMSIAILDGEDMRLFPVSSRFRNSNHLMWVNNLPVAGGFHQCSITNRTRDKWLRADFSEIHNRHIANRQSDSNLFQSDEVPNKFILILMTENNAQSLSQDKINIESDADVATWQPSDRLLVSLPRRIQKVAAATHNPAVVAATSPAKRVAKATASNTEPAASVPRAPPSKDLGLLLRNSEAKQQQAAKSKALEDETLLEAARKHRAKEPAAAGPLKKKGKKVPTTSLAEAAETAETSVDEVAATIEPFVDEVAATMEPKPTKVKPTKGTKKTSEKSAPKSKATKVSKKALEKSSTGGQKIKGRKSAPLHTPVAEPSDAEPSDEDSNSATPVGQFRARVETLGGTSTGASGDEAGFQNTHRKSCLDKLFLLVNQNIWTSGCTQINHFSRIFLFN